APAPYQFPASRVDPEVGGNSLRKGGWLSDTTDHCPPFVCVREALGGVFPLPPSPSARFGPVPSYTGTHRSRGYPSATPRRSAKRFPSPATVRTREPSLSRGRASSEMFSGHDDPIGHAPKEHQGRARMLNEANHPRTVVDVCPAGKIGGLYGASSSGVLA